MMRALPLTIGTYRGVRKGSKAAGDELLRLARRWLACHEAIGALLGHPELPHVAQARAILLQALLSPDASQ